MMSARTNRGWVYKARAASRRRSRRWEVCGRAPQSRNRGWGGRAEEPGRPASPVRSSGRILRSDPATLVRSGSPDQDPPPRESLFRQSTPAESGDQMSWPQHAQSILPLETEGRMLVWLHKTTGNSQFTHVTKVLTPVVVFQRVSSMFKWQGSELLTLGEVSCHTGRTHKQPQEWRPLTEPHEMSADVAPNCHGWDKKENPTLRQMTLTAMPHKDVCLQN
nr:uncharacterized protein LOC114106181 [Marmota flaviventris]